MTHVRLTHPASHPDIGTSRGTVQPEPVETEGVVCVLWDGRELVCWHKREDLIDG